MRELQPDQYEVGTVYWGLVLGLDPLGVRFRVPENLLTVGQQPPRRRASRDTTRPRRSVDTARTRRRVEIPRGGDDDDDAGV